MLKAVSTMDVLDTPLNQAHQQGRRADRCLLAGKYDEAVRCHQMAAGLLSEALKMTKTKEAIQSLQLQQKFHLRQTDIVRLKQKQTEAQKLAQRQNQSGGTIVQDDSASWSKDFPHGVHSEDLLDMAADNSEGGNDNGALRTIQECDSLLLFLNNRHSMDYKSMQQAPMQPSRRMIKDESQIIEELRIHNEALRRHVFDLLEDKDLADRELHSCQQENRALRSRIAELERRNTNPNNRRDSHEDSELDRPAQKVNLDDLASMDLPPLEVPKFDFSQLTITDSSSNENVSNATS